jgi:hypothetical protein
VEGWSGASGGAFFRWSTHIAAALSAPANRALVRAAHCEPGAHRFADFNSARAHKKRLKNRRFDAHQGAHGEPQKNNL